MYKYKIIYYLMQLDNTSLSRAYETWKDAFRFDEKVYQIMLHVLDKEQPRLLINRNPTLNYYSMVLMKIRTIKKDITDYTLAVPLSILPGLNADQLSRSESTVMCFYVRCELLTRGVTKVANGIS